MAGQKFLQHDGSGNTTEVVSTQAGGSGNENLLLSLDSTGRVASTAMPVGVGADTVTATASGAIAAGDMVHFMAAGTVQKADATDNTKNAHGFVLANVADTESALVYLEGPITGLTGLTPGAAYFLSAATPGLATATPPTGTGKIVQRIGNAVSATVINFEPDSPIILA